MQTRRRLQNQVRHGKLDLAGRAVAPGWQGRVAVLQQDGPLRPAASTDDGMGGLRLRRRRLQCGATEAGGGMIPVEVTQTPWHYTTFWDWADHWQTLLAGFLAFVAGV